MSRPERVILRCSGWCTRKDRHGWGEVLGIAVPDEDGRPFVNGGWGQKFRVTMDAEAWEQATTLDEEAFEAWKAEHPEHASSSFWPAEGKAVLNVHPRLDEDDEPVSWRLGPCPVCRSAWALRRDKLIDKWPVLAARQPPVAVLGVDVGEDVGRQAGR